MYVKTTLLKGPGSIGPIFGLKIFENLKLFTVIEFCSQYEDIILLYVKTCFKTLIIRLVLPWKHRWMGFCLIFSIIFGTSHGYLDATPRGDQPKTFHKLRV